jgi:predicted transcriptional regulator
MNIEIRDPDLRARLQRQIESTESGNVEEALLRLIETQEEQDRWLAENRAAIDAQIRRGIAELDRGEGIPEHELDSYLARLKAKQK